MNKYLIGLLIVVLAGITYLGVSYPKANLGASPAGSTFGDAKQAMIAINLAAPGANATSSSVYNGDANDRYVTSLDYGCEGVGTSKTAYTGAGLAALTMTVGTTTTPAPAVIPSALVLASATTIATSSATLVVASSTSGGAASALWPTGTYMTFWFNATNTAVCTVGVKYFGG